MSDDKKAPEFVVDIEDGYVDISRPHDDFVTARMILHGREFEDVVATANRIVRAVNSHDALVGACQEALRMLDVTEWGGTPGHDCILAALKLAEEGGSP